MAPKFKCKGCRKELDPWEGHTLTKSFPGIVGHEMSSAGVDKICDDCWEKGVR